MRVRVPPTAPVLFLILWSSPDNTSISPVANMDSGPVGCFSPTEQGLSGPALGRILVDWLQVVQQHIKVVLETSGRRQVTFTGVPTGFGIQCGGVDLGTVKVERAGGEDVVISLVWNPPQDRWDSCPMEYDIQVDEYMEDFFISLREDLEFLNAPATKSFEVRAGGKFACQRGGNKPRWVFYRDMENPTDEDYTLCFQDGMFVVKQRGRRLPLHSFLEDLFPKFSPVP